jgi:thymidylate synthase ThyX
VSLNGETALRDIRFLLKPHYSKSWALIIGINEYKDVSPLCYAVNDAQEIREILIQAQRKADLRFEI